MRIQHLGNVFTAVVFAPNTITPFSKSPVAMIELMVSPAGPIAPKPASGVTVPFL